MNLKEEKPFVLDTERLVKNEIEEKIREIAELNNVVKRSKEKIVNLRRSIHDLRVKFLPMSNSFAERLNASDANKG